MNDKVSCSTCKFYEREIIKEDVSANQGRCLRYPPTMIPAPQQTPQGIQMGLMGVNVAVQGRGWCGEWQAIVIQK